jgi:hypothetical protein
VSGQKCTGRDLIQIKAWVFEFLIFNMIYNISATNAEVLDILCILVYSANVCFLDATFLKETLKYYHFWRLK